MLAPQPKSGRSSPWYVAPSLPVHRAFLIGGATLGLWVLYCLTPASAWLTRWETKLSFLSRQTVGLAPRVHANLKIFAVDQQTLGAAELESVPLSAWNALLKSFAETKPRAVLADGIFSFVPASNAKAVESFRNRGEGPPLYGGMAWSELERTGRSLLPMDCCGFDAASWIGARGSLGETAPTIRNGFLHGPNPQLLGGFKRLGHLGVRTDGSLDLVIRPASGTLIPHWSILFAEPLLWLHGKLLAAGKEIPIDREGRAMPNYPKPETISVSISTLAPLLQKALKREPLAGLNEGDTILLVNQAFPGDWPMVDSPVGSVPAVYASIAMVNDTLVGKWIRQAPWPCLWIGLGGALGVWLGYAYSPVLFALTEAAAVGLIALSGLLVFFFGGQMYPWLLSAVGCALCGAVVFVVRLRAERRLGRSLRTSLQGILGPEALDHVLSDPADLDVRPSTQLVTVLCLDVVDFSLGAERDSPEQAFRFWKEERAWLAPSVHRHGGIVLRTPGDGLIAVFGYPYLNKSKADPNHAEAAVRCALEIQRSVLSRNERHFAQGLPLYPVRIGVHTDRMFVGDTGTDSHVELTLIGNGVTFAFRLEAACEPYRVQIGSSTRDRLSTLAHEMKGLHKRFIRVPEQEELLDAYEVNPFFETPGRLELGIDHYRKRAALSRLESRWPVESVGWLVADTQWGRATVVNFSRGGLALRFEHYYGAGVTFALRLDSGNGKLAEACQEIGLSSITAEVRWGRPDGDGYLHGLAFKNLTTEQKEKLFEVLHALHLGQPISSVA